MSRKRRTSGKKSNKMSGKCGSLIGTRSWMTASTVRLRVMLRKTKMRANKLSNIPFCTWTRVIITGLALCSRAVSSSSGNDWIDSVSALRAAFVGLSHFLRLDALVGGGETLSPVEPPPDEVPSPLGPLFSMSMIKSTESFEWLNIEPTIGSLLVLCWW